MNITEELIEALAGVSEHPDIHLGDLVYKVRESEGEGWDGPRVTAWSNATEKAKEVLAKARALQQAPPTTVIGWLELARDAGLPWAESAIEQIDAGPHCVVTCLYRALYEFADWPKTKEGDQFWAPITELSYDITLGQLREMARARKEAQ